MLLFPFGLSHGDLREGRYICTDDLSVELAEHDKLFDTFQSQIDGIVKKFGSESAGEFYQGTKKQDSSTTGGAYHASVVCLNSHGYDTCTLSQISINGDPIDEKSWCADASEKSSEPKIPEWVKNSMKWFIEGSISEDEMISALQFLVKEGIIKV